MPETSKIHVLIAAAGVGERFIGGHSKVPKQYHLINGVQIIERSISKFKKINNISSISCIINPKHKEMLSGINGIRLIEGGKTRKESVFNGLKGLPDVKNEDVVLIHDAARPLVPLGDIEALINSLKTCRAATLAKPVSSTLRKQKDECCDEIVDRNQLWAIQTPQAFRYADIIKAHEKSPNDATDDTSLVTKIGVDVKLVQGSPENFKITTYDDFMMAEKLIKAQSTIRTGLGYDVHAFDNTTTGPIRLGGIDIEHTHKLKGHSDADVALHTITDALLGAISEGDIGQHFPPSDNTYKDMDSAVFLEKARDLLNEHNASINNIDLTIICEAPKIGPHAQKMRTRIATILDIQECAINVKATTSEKLGFTGRKEGIAAQAIATVTING